MLALAAMVFGVIVFAPKTMADSSGLIFTALQTSSNLDYAEIYNSSNEPVDMDGWSVEVTITDADNSSSNFVCSINLSGWLRPQSYGILADQGIVQNDSNQLTYKNSQCSPSGFKAVYVSKLVLKNNETVFDSLSPTDQEGAWVRKHVSSVSNKYRSTGNFDDDFDSVSNITLQTGGWYDGPQLQLKV